MIERLARTTGQDEIAIAQRRLAKRQSRWRWTRRRPLRHRPPQHQPICRITPMPPSGGAGSPQLKAVGYERRAARLRRRIFAIPPGSIWAGIDWPIERSLPVCCYARRWGALLAKAVTLVTLIPALTLAVVLVNGVVSRLLPPYSAQARLRRRRPCRVPDDGCRALLISTKADVASLTSQLEALSAQPRSSSVLCLAQRFRRCTAGGDAGRRAALIDLATERIEEAERPNIRARPFYLFHRKRLWNTAKKSGWDGSASGASCTSSTVCCAAFRDLPYNVQVGDVTILRPESLCDHPRRRRFTIFTAAS